MALISRLLEEKRQMASRYRQIGLIGIVFAVGLFVCMAVFSESDKRSSLLMGTRTIPKILQHGVLEYSMYGDARSVAYYHCASQMSPEGSTHLVLLHGAKYTKETWKESGILRALCENPHISVSAMDLPVSADHAEFMGMLNAMKDSHKIDLPVALVTPSASGKTIVDWMASGNLQDLPSYVNKWIPVACASLKTSTEDQLAKMAELEGFKIFAIYGDQDIAGRSVTNLLATSVQAKIMEIEGEHAVYLNSPDAFCTAVLDDLGVLQV